jgi:hypothetical protein
VLKSLNLAANNLGQLALPEGWSGPYDDEKYYKDRDGKYHEQAPAGSKPEGIIALANVIPDMRALSVLNLASNKLGEIELPDGWSYSRYYNKYNHTDGREQKENPGKPECIIAIAMAIPDMGAISSVNLLLNDIGVDQAEDLVGILKEHPTLKSLCGNMGNETELDMSGKMRGAGDAIMLVAEIVDNGALLRLDMSDNEINFNISGEAAAVPGKALADALAANTVLTELNLSKNILKPEFIRELAVGIGDNGALTTLNLSSNYLEAEGAKIVAEAIEVTACAFVVVLAPFSCPSDHRLNCCCLLLSIG